MADNPSTFSEVWYRVSNQSVTLRAQVKVQRQNFRGEKWFVLQDPFNNQFFRLRPQAYEFLARLNPKQTLEETWLECLEYNPDSTPGQEEIIQLLTQLYHANLIHYDLPADSQKFFDRYTKRKKKETKSTLFNIMFAKFPFLDPDDFLNRVKPYIHFCLNPITFGIGLITLLWAIKVCIDNWAELWNQGQSVLSSNNLPLLYGCIILIKVCHEFGHAFMCKKYDGEVHKMGIMLMLFTPIPFIDASSSWAFPSKWRRILVGSAGMIIELFIASIAVFVWANTGDGLIHSMAYNLIFIASVTTLLFNGNPLLRYDGYYILSDLLEIPNLTSRSIQQLRYYGERYILRLKKLKPVANNLKEATWLTIYGITSFIYRIVVFTGIILFVANQFLILGIIMAIICIVSWGFAPLFRFINYLSTSPKLERNRIQAITNTVFAICSIFILLGAIPFPHYFHAPGVLKAKEFSQVSNDYPGFFSETFADSGTYVTAGQPLFRIRNETLNYDLRTAIAKLKEMEAVYLNALNEETENIAPIESQIEVIKDQIAYYKTRQNLLTVKAPHTGIWIAPELEKYEGMWSARGEPIGTIINTDSFYFSSIVSQNDVSRLFSDTIRSARIRLVGESEYIISTNSQKMIPAEQSKLPSAALGFSGGGDISVSSSDIMQTNEPFFEVRSDLISIPEVVETHGRTGRIRFSLKPKPILKQWWRSFKQLLQDRYQI
jgi:putative peptide zinc metalloprotease protein